MGKARRQEIGANVSDAVDNAKNAARKKLKDVNTRRKAIEEAAEKQDPIAIARSMNFIDPWMTDERQANKAITGVAMSTERRLADAEIPIILNPGEIKYTQESDLTFEDVGTMNDFWSKSEFSKQLATDSLKMLLKDAEDRFDDVELDINITEDGTFEGEWQLSESQKRTKLGQKIQEAEKMAERAFNGEDIRDDVINSPAFKKARQNAFESVRDEHMEAVVKQFVNQSEDWDHDMYWRDANTGNLKIVKELEDELNVALQKHNGITLAHLRNPSPEAQEQLKQAKENLKQFLSLTT
jgi:hypothetical protein